MVKTVIIKGTEYRFPDKKPELLMPAGDIQKAKFAIAYGADAVYAGVPMFALRSKENKVDFTNIKEIVDYVHSKHKKIYLTLNIYAHNSKLKPLQNTIQTMINLQPDAFIVSDPGIIQLIGEQCGEANIPLHLSTQANTTNWASVKFWKRNGVSRIILARELTLKEITEIKNKVPIMELESFIHGSMCMSYSGRCLLSNFMTGRDANQGTCAQNCRWEYKVFKENNKQKLGSNKEKDLQEIKRSTIDSNDTYYLEEKLRPGELIPVEEDTFGTYFMSSRDLCSVEFLAEVIATGVDSLKVEGRNKSVYYAAIVANVYRKAIDALYQGREIDYEQAIQELAATGNRGFIPGFYFGDLQHNSTRYESNVFMQTHTFIGIVNKVTQGEPNGSICINVKNRIDLGDDIELITPTQQIYITAMEMKNEKGEDLTVIHPGQGTVIIPIPQMAAQYLKKDKFILARMKGQQKRKKM